MISGGQGRGDYDHIRAPQTQQPTSKQSQVFFFFSILLQIGFFVLIFFFLADTNTDQVRNACKENLWGLVLARTVCALLEWVVQISTAGDPRLRPDSVLLLYKLPFAIAFTVVLPEAIDGGVCVQVSQSSNALVIISWIYLVIDWISSVAQLILLCLNRQISMR
jgi:hypothetical protein